MTAMFLTIRNASRKSWWQTILWVGYNALGSLIPIWGTYFLIRLHRQHFQMNDFVKHGEFALYAATFLAPALQLVVRNIRDSRYLLGTGAVLAAVFGLLISVVLYSGVVVGVKSPQEIDEVFLFWTSIGLFALSLGFAVLVTLIENEQLNPNVRKTEAAEQSILNEKFSQKRPEMALEGPESVAPEDSVVPSEDDLVAKFKPVVNGPHSHDEEGGGNG